MGRKRRLSAKKVLPQDAPETQARAESLAIGRYPVKDFLSHLLLQQPIHDTPGALPAQIVFRFRVPAAMAPPPSRNAARRADLTKLAELHFVSSSAAPFVNPTYIPYNL